MLRSLRGTIRKAELPFIILDVGGVGYDVQCTLPLWEKLEEGTEAQIATFTFVREDRLELFGFPSEVERKLFSHFLSVPGIGPRTALQLCGVPVSVLARAVETQDARSLSSLKGIGKKMAEKLLVELQALVEKGILRASKGGGEGEDEGMIDHDALEALTNLGYDERSILTHLRKLPRGLKTTEERVKHVLQTL
jgi:Holliday junction DNA helicase RuvA